MDFVIKLLRIIPVSVVQTQMYTLPVCQTKWFSKSIFSIILYHSTQRYVENEREANVPDNIDCWDEWMLALVLEILELDICAQVIAYASAWRNCLWNLLSHTPVFSMYILSNILHIFLFPFCFSNIICICILFESSRWFLFFIFILFVVFVFVCHSVWLPLFWKYILSNTYIAQIFCGIHIPIPLNILYSSRRLCASYKHIKSISILTFVFLFIYIYVLSVYSPSAEYIKYIHFIIVVCMRVVWLYVFILYIFVDIFM